jgi:gas vesicle protein
MDNKGIWIAFGVGVAAGASVALLYAPQSGDRTRRQLRRNLDDGVDYLEDAADYLKKQAERLSKEAQKTIKRTKGQVEELVDKASTAVSDAASSATKSVQSLM